MKFKSIKYLSLIALSAIMFTSCIKDSVDDLEEGAGSNFLKIAESPEKAYFFDVFDDVKKIQLFELRRDVNSEAALNSSVTVTVQVDESALETYNDEHGSNFELLPEDLYTLDPSFTKTGPNTYKTTFAPGEIAKQFIINMDGSKWDIAHVYGLPFKIVDPGGLKVSNVKPDVISLISVKNQYDGVYQLDGAFYHPSQSPGYDPFTLEMELHTTGPNSVKIYWPGEGYYAPGLFGGSLNAFGLQEPEITIDPVTNQATVQNAASGAVTFYTMAPNYDSHYDPDTKTIYVKYGYNYLPGPVFDPTANREWTYVFTYLRPR